MKVLILAGGHGTRLEEETVARPKPLVEIGGQPILWHIMKHFAAHGYREFLIAVGYKGEAIRRYFIDHQAWCHDLTVNLADGSVTANSPSRDGWSVRIVDTGLNTNTGGRVLRLRSLLGNEPFFLTYGDGVSNVDLEALLSFHRDKRCALTLTAVRPPARFGAIDIKGGLVTEFKEKPGVGDGWVNGGFMVCEPAFFDYLVDDHTGLEVLSQLARDGQVAAYQHPGYWQCMDTIRDKRRLEEEWSTGAPGWKTW